MKIQYGEALDDFSAALHVAIDEAAAKVKEPLERVAELAHDASDKAATARSQATDWLHKRGEQIAEPSKKLVDDATSYVAANPFKAIGIALVAALVVGRLMR